MLQTGVDSDQYPFARLLFLVGSTLIIFYAALLMVQTGALLIRLNLNDAATLLAAALSLAYYWLVGVRLYRLHWRALAVGFLGLLLLSAVCALVAGYYFDLSWDGRDYQQKAIRELVAGWNPLYSVLQPENVYDNTWLNHYPKGAWIAAASVVRLFNHIEAGKIFNLLLIAAVFFVAFSFFLLGARLKTWQAGLLAFFLAANPVSVYQSLSYYTDGQVSSILILLVLLMLLCLRSADAGCLLTLCATLVVGLNLKFTATAYIFLLLAAFALASLYRYRRQLSRLAPLWAAALSGVLLGILLVGYDPYLTNTFRNGNPFYPLYGSSTFNKDYILQGQIPPDFVSEGWLEKLFRSVFSASQNRVGVDSGPLKFPLSVSRAEIVAFARPDVRLSGWGPLFGALVILSLVSLVILALISRPTAAAAVCLIGLLMLSSLLNSEAWWARYSPQLWLVPVIVLAALWYIQDKRTQLLGCLLAALMFVNLLLVSGAYVGWNTVSTARLRATLHELQQSGEGVVLYYGPLEAAGMRLQEYGIPYQWVARPDELPCPLELELMVYYSPLDCSSPP